MKKIEFARSWLKLGVAVIPLRHRGKEPEAGMMGGEWETYKTQLPTEYDLVRWFGSDWQNYGVICGWNNLAVIDFDEFGAYEIWKSYFETYLVRVYEVKEQPYTVISARGAHVYIRLFGDYSNQKRRSVDVKIHGYVVGAGCVHPSGKVYEAQNMNFDFPQVFDLDTVLPVELFPKIAPEASTGQMEAFLEPFDKVSQPYDAFAAASVVSGEDLLTRVKRSVRIETLFRDVKKTSNDGRWYAAVCPFHDDHKPSMWIDVKRQICGCQVCGMKPMDAVNLYARMYNVSESAAVSILAQEVGVWG